MNQTNEFRGSTREEWEQILRDLKWQEPFRPFTVVLKTGERGKAIDWMAVGFGGGNGGVITPEGDSVSFALDELDHIVVHTTAEVAHD